jgi:BatD DUF11 like domain
MRAASMLIGALLAAALPVAAQSSISAQLDTTTATVGDQITMTVTVDHPADARVVWPDSLDLAPFEVLAKRTLPDQARGAETRSSAELTLAAFELGDLQLPSFDVSVIGADSTQEELHTDPFGVHVESVGKDDSGDIRDIRGPLGMPMSTLRMLMWLALPLLAAVLLYAVARRLRPRRHRGDPPALGALPRPAHEIALDALAALEASGKLERGQVKEYHIDVSDILRTYVEARFRVDALEMTTIEVLDGLRRAGAPERFSDGLRAFLEQCDLVKFAKVRPAPEQCRQVLELGRRLVLDSRPVGEVTPETVEAAVDPTSEGAAEPAGAAGAVGGEP